MTPIDRQATALLEDPSPPEPKISITDLCFSYGETGALHDLSIDFAPNAVTSLIGPSGCGKTTLLRCLNRMNDFSRDGRRTGRVLIDGVDIYGKEIAPEQLRKMVGMVFQKPNPFPGSIIRNITYGPRIHGIKKKSQLEDLAEECLRKTGLWSEVRDKLHQDALTLSGGQQQRLCIARALAIKPTVLLMDEPCSALDPIATTRIEDLMNELKTHYTIVLVTHNMQQAQRASDFTAFMIAGRLVEFSQTKRLFLHPRRKETDDYISGRFG